MISAPDVELNGNHNYLRKDNLMSFNNLVVNYITKAIGNPKLALPARSNNPKVSRLYRKAKQGQWDFEKERNFPKTCEEINEWLGVTDEIRRASGKTFSSFYYGEHGAKLISAQLTLIAPTNEAAKFLSTQTMDEARHMEVFEGILEFIDEIHPINPFLNAFLGDILRVKHFEDKLVGMNLLVEGLALSAFQMLIKKFRPGVNCSEQGYKAIGEPIERIIRDESRHVGFGVMMLPEILSNLNRRRKMTLRIRQLGWLALLYGSVKFHQKDLEIMGLDYLKLLDNLIEDHERRVVECGGDALISTDRMKSIIPTIDKVVNRMNKH